jgi:NADPH2:quinone reductase
MNTFNAFRIYDENGGIKARITQLELKDLSVGEVVIQVQFSSVNYKDALAGTGKGKILRHFPLNGGIDAAGVVLTSESPQFKAGQKVVVTGCGIGEEHDGGYSEILRVKASSVIALPNGLDPREAMILGTAGFTAALALHRMRENHQSPEMGPILVTGASGGVGSFAVQMLAQQGFKVIAMSAKPDVRDYLKKLGADQVLTLEQLGLGPGPLGRVKFGGVIDNVGGEVLAKALAHTQLWGNVCSIGLAASPDLKSTVMPFILRGVSLLGVSSNNCPLPLREKIWQELAAGLKPKHLEDILRRTIKMPDLPVAFDALLKRQVQGRILVDLRKAT